MPRKHELAREAVRARYDAIAKWCDWAGRFATAHRKDAVRALGTHDGELRSSTSVETSRDLCGHGRAVRRRPQSLVQSLGPPKPIVCKPGVFLQFSISHPCYDTPHRRNLRDEHGVTYGYEVGDHFRNLQGETLGWLFSAAPPELRATLPKFKVPRFTRTLSQWLNGLIEKGFIWERIEEPRPDDETVREHPNIQDAQVVAYFMIVRARKPG